MITLKASHTPGPWKVVSFFKSPLQDDGFEHLTHDIHSVDGVYLASAFYVNNPNKAQVGYLRPLNREEMEANAKLIATAPELLEACKELLLRYAPYGSGDSDARKLAIQNAESAIKKATGN